MGVSIKVGGAYVPHQFALKQGGVYVPGASAFKAAGAYVGVGAGSLPLVYPLDEAGALPLAAYGVKRLSAAYSGPAIRVRRADAVEVDIGFSGQNLDLTALTAHLGTATGTVTTFYDLTGNGRHATQTLVANQGSIQASLFMSGGLTVSLGDAGWYDLPAGISIDRRNGEVCGVFEQWTTKQQVGFYEIGTVANANLNVFTLASGAIRATPPGSNAAFKPQSRPVWIDHYGASTGVYFEQDGETQTGAAPTTATSSGGYFGRIVTGGYFGRFHHGMIAFYNRVLSAGERSALKAAASGIFEASSTGGVLMYTGDSILASSTATTLRNGIAHQITPLLATSPKEFNLSGGGEQLVNDLVGGSSGFAGDEGGVLSRYTSDRRVVFVFKGTNDMGAGGRTSAQVYADLQAFCGSVRSNGGFVIVATLLPRTSYGLSTLAEFTAFNNSVRTNWATFADGFVDFANEASMGAAGAESNTTLYSDGLHPTAYGNSLLAAAAAPEINRVFALP
jgi:lysophospholipase L1-like esterase